MPPVKIPFDSLSLWAVVGECQSLLGARIRHISQPRPLEITLTLFANGVETRLLLSADAQFARMHLASRKPANPPSPPNFCSALRKYLEGGFVRAIQQVGFDRIARLCIDALDGQTYHLIAELMGKHSNLILTQDDQRVLSAIKWVSPSKSRARPIHPGVYYAPPPTHQENRLNPLLTTVEQAREAVRLHTGSHEPPDTGALQAVLEGMSGFTATELSLGIQESGWQAFAEWQETLSRGQWQPVLVMDTETQRTLGVYPLRVRQIPESSQTRCESVSLAWERHTQEAMTRAESESLRDPLAGQLQRALKARESALRQVREAADQSAYAAKWQLYAELILAFGQHQPEGQKMLEAQDYTQPDAPVLQIPLDPEKSAVENAERYFNKARRAKENREGLLARKARLEAERGEIQALLTRVQFAPDQPHALQGLADEALRRGWLREMPDPALTHSVKQKDPFDGHRIRQFVSEEGYQVLMGENALANDFLLTRIARPNDYWLHVRSTTGAHVIIRTENRPEAVPRKTLEFAGRLAALNSTDKHASVVDVDYTLRKYVRKPRKAAPGLALYSHEKTIQIRLK